MTRGIAVRDQAAERIAAATLDPATAQRTFRAVLDALARPGTVVELPTGNLPPVLLPVAALADLGTGVCVLDDGAGWDDVVRVATNAPSTSLVDARLVAAVRPVAAAEISALHRGTALAPEEGALAAIPVSSVDGGPPLRLSGPGIAETRDVAPAGLPDGFVAARAKAGADFPAGVDLLLIDPAGRMVGLPRTTAITESGDASARPHKDRRGCSARPSEGGAEPCPSGRSLSYSASVDIHRPSRPDVELDDVEWERD